MRLTRLLFLLNSPPVFAYNLIAGFLYRRRHRGGRLLLLRAGRVAL